MVPNMLAFLQQEQQRVQAQNPYGGLAEALDAFAKDRQAGQAQAWQQEQQTQQRQQWAQQAEKLKRERAAEQYGAAGKLSHLLLSQNQPEMAAQTLQGAFPAYKDTTGQDLSQLNASGPGAFMLRDAGPTGQVFSNDLATALANQLSPRKTEWINTNEGDIRTQVDEYGQPTGRQIKGPPKTFAPKADKALQRGAPEWDGTKWKAPVFDPATGKTVYVDANQPTSNVNSQATLNERRKEFKVKTAADVVRAKQAADREARILNTDKITGYVDEAGYAADRDHAYALIDDSFAAEQQKGKVAQAEKEAAATKAKLDAASKKADTALKRQFGANLANLHPDVAGNMRNYYIDLAMGKASPMPYTGEQLRLAVEQAKQGNYYSPPPATAPKAAPTVGPRTPNPSPSIADQVNDIIKGVLQ